MVLFIKLCQETLKTEYMKLLLQLHMLCPLTWYLVDDDITA